MNVGNFVGSSLGMKLVNGKIKPKFGIPKVLAILIMISIFTLAFYGLMYGIKNMDVEFIVMPSLIILAFGYVALISPYTQNPKNYYIEFLNEDSLAGFKLFYKGKLVDIKHKIDNEGRIAFANNESKLSCLSYADGTKMSNLVKYKINNYFIMWLNDNKLLSSEVTVTFEEL